MIQDFKNLDKSINSGCGVIVAALAIIITLIIII